MNFTWDARRAASNRKKHGVSFEEAATVFGDPLALAREDAVDPGRTLLLGTSVELADETIRLISARRATSHERRRYEEGP